MLDEIIAKIIKAIKKFFGESEKKPASPTPTPPASQPQPSLPKPPTGNVDPAGDQVLVSDPAAKIDSFLWKPTSETNPKVTSISISADLARAEDIKIQIKGKDGKLIPNLNETYNVGGTRRGNQLPNMKFGRLVHKPGLKAEQFKKYAPLEVFYFLELNGKRTPMKVMGKDSIKIKDPTQRLELK